MTSLAHVSALMLAQHSLPRRLAIYVILVSLLTGVLLSVIEVAIRYHDIRSDIEKDVRDLITTTLPTAEEAVFKLDPQIANILTSGLVQYGAIVRSSISDEQGRVLSSSHQERSHVWRPLGLPNTLIQVQVPITNSVKTGSYEVEIDIESGLNSFYRGLLLTISKTFIQVLLIATLVYLVVLYVIARPVTALSAAIGRSQPGEEVKNLPGTERTDELGNLARCAANFASASYHSHAERNLILNTVDESVVATDSSGNIVYANAPTEESFSLEKSQLVNTPISSILEMFSEHDAANILQEFSRTNNASLLNQLPRESIAIKSTGEKFPVEVSIGAAGFSDGERLIFSIRDLTEEKRSRDQNEKLEERLRQSQKMEAIGQLAGGIAHDFNNMLTVILGHAELSKTKLKEHNFEDLRNSLDLIESSGHRAAALTQQLLLFSRKDIIKAETLDVATVLKEPFQMLERLIPENIKLELYNTSHAIIDADRGQIEQVVINLALNARDAIPDGGVITVEVTDIDVDQSYLSTQIDTQPGPHVQFTVSDTGKGMSAEIVPRIFEPFFTTKEQGEGTGLGLANVYAIVKKWHGDIQVYSEPDHGTSVKVLFPIAESKALSGIEDAGLEPTISLEGLTVLVCEDDDDIRDLICKILTEVGSTVFDAGDPEEAIELAREHAGDVDLLITDVIMPKMNGKELSRKIEIYCDLECLFISGYTSNVIVHHGVVDDGINFLEKPFTRPKLLAAIREIMSRTQT